MGYDFENARQKLLDRKERATKITLEDESDSGVVVILYSEDHLHVGHEVDHYETLADNSIEVTVWNWCQNCKIDYWHSSTEIASAPWS